MADPTGDLFGAFIGGAIGGAAITAVSNVWLEWRRGRREDTWRFADKKRETYVVFARSMDAWLNHAYEHLMDGKPLDWTFRGAADDALTEVRMLSGPIGTAALAYFSGVNDGMDRVRALPTTVLDRASQLNLAQGPLRVAFLDAVRKDLALK